MFVIIERILFGITSAKANSILVLKYLNSDIKKKQNKTTIEKSFIREKSFVESIIARS